MEVYCELCDKLQEDLYIPNDFGLCIWIKRDNHYNTESMIFTKGFDSEFSEQKLEIQLTFEGGVERDNKIIKFQQIIKGIENRLFEEKENTCNTNIGNICDDCIIYMLKYGVVKFNYENNPNIFNKFVFEAPCNICNNIGLLNYCVAKYRDNKIYIVKTNEYFDHLQPHIVRYRIGYLADVHFEQKIIDNEKLRVCENCFIAHQQNREKIMFSSYYYDKLVEEYKSCLLCQNEIVNWCECENPFCEEHSKICISCNEKYLCKYCVHEDKCFWCYIATFKS